MSFKIQKPDEIEFTLTLTMPLRAWKNLREQMREAKDYDWPPDTSATGITGTYFNGQSQNTWIATRRDSTIDFSWGLGSPNPGVTVDTWSVQWVGKVVVPTSGAYTFYLNSDDGGRVYLDGTMYIDHMQEQALTEWTATMTLLAGEHRLTVEYTARTGNAEWSGPGITKRIVPRSALR